jgi:F0F1-type ATP synthase assembly protein I
LSDQRGEKKERPSGGAGPEESVTRQAASAYQGALEAVVALLVAMGAGYWVDQRFDTAPTGLLVGTAIGFGAFVLRIWRMRPQDRS